MKDLKDILYTLIRRAEQDPGMPKRYPLDGLLISVAITSAKEPRLRLQISHVRYRPTQVEWDTVMAAWPYHYRQPTAHFDPRVGFCLLSSWRPDGSVSEPEPEGTPVSEPEPEELPASPPPIPIPEVRAAETPNQIVIRIPRCHTCQKAWSGEWDIDRLELANYMAEHFLCFDCGITEYARFNGDRWGLLPYAQPIRR